MANLENNNSENNKPISEKVGETIFDATEKVSEKIHDVAEGVKHTIEHPVDAAKETVNQAAEDVKHLSWWARLFLWLLAIGSVIFLAILIIINLPATKDYAASRALGFLEKDFGVKISKESVEVNIFGDVIINGLRIKDFKNNDLIYAKKFRADSDWFSILKIGKSRELDFSTLTLENADVKVVTYKGDSIDNFNRFIAKFDDGKPRDPKKAPFKLNSRVVIKDSKISIINQNHDGDEGKWLQAENVNLIAPSLNVIGPNIKARINNFTFKTKRWGKEHFVDTFSTNFEMTKEKLSLKELTFFTDHSLLQGDITFNLDKETHWQDFTNKVIWDMKMKRVSAISGYDISYFATKWDNYKPINLSGEMYGFLNDFRLNNFALTGDNVNIYSTDTRFKNLLQGNFNIVSKNISTNFTYPSLRAMVPSFVVQKMKNFADPFGRIQYKGFVDVTPKRVIAKGNAITTIGRANADIVLSGIDEQNPRYVGVLDVKDFNTSALTKNNSVGLISGKFNVDGRGFDVNTLTLKTKSNISRIDVAGKTINNLYLDGVLSQKQYNGIVNINDEEARGKIAGKIDFSTPKLIADIKANIDYLNLSYFGVQGNGKAIFSGNVDGKVAFKDINDMNLDANLNDVVFYAGSQRIDVPNGDVKAYFQNGNRIVDVDVPNVVKGNISGKYNLGDLSKMLQNGFDKVLVGTPQKKLYRGQQFTYNFDISQKLINYFEPNLKIPEGAKIDGSYNGNSNDLILNLNSSYLKYIMTKKEEISQADRLLAQANPDYKLDENKVTKDSAMINNVMVRINTANPTEQIFAKINRVEYNKNILQDVTFTGNNENNSILHLAANFKHGTKEDEENNTMKSYAINLNQSRDANGDFVIKFEPTELKLNNFTWNVDTSPELNHSITYRKKTGDFLIKNLRLYSDESELFIKESVFKNAKDFTADADVKNLEISKILDLLPNQKGNLDLKGIANGNIQIKMDKTNLVPLIDLEIKDIFLSGKNMGNMIISAKNSSVSNVYDINTKIVSSDLLGKNQLEITGTIDNNTKSPTLNLSADLQDFNLGFVQAFVNGIFSNFRGKASGIVTINGPLNDINYGGNISLKDFGLKINFNGVDYSFADSNIILNNGRLLLGEDAIKIKDGRNNSSGTLSQLYIDMSNLSSIKAQVFVRSENLMLLNTEQKDFDLFWGKIYGKGALDVSFDEKGLKIYAGDEDERVGKFEPFQILNNSIFTLNSNTANAVDEFKMLRFLKEDTTGVVSVDEGVKKKVSMDISLLLSVDKGSSVNVLVGDEIGDISVRGNSEKLKFVMKPNGNITLDGAYSVDSGSYISKAILEKTFQIDKSSSISWDGDPFNPALDIVANYYKTVSNASEYLGVGNLPPINVQLQTSITQNLKNPKIEFDVLTPDVSSQVKEALAAKLNTDQEVTLQFGSILVLNNFNVSDNGGFNNVDIGNVGSDLVSNLLLKQLGNVINTISEQFQIDLNYIKGDRASNTSDVANTSLNVSLSPRWRFKTSLGIPISRNSVSNDNTFSGQAEYDLSKKNDGSLILRVYSKPSNIGLGSVLNTGANQTYGAGIVYSKSFNSFFKKKKTVVDSLQKKDTIINKSSDKDTIK